MYYYETHSHTLPSSKCAKIEADEMVRFYYEQGYDGVFITNHFLDGNSTIKTKKISWEEKITEYFDDYRAAKAEGDKIGIKVFPGVEMTYGGTDFLVYGLPEDWYIAHPEIMHLDKRYEIEMLRREGALVIQAHPFREAAYIDHIRLYPRSVDGVEIINANRNELANNMAKYYAEQYELFAFAGSDNHSGPGNPYLAGMCSETPINSVEEFITAFREGKLEVFTREIKKEVM